MRVGTTVHVALACVLSASALTLSAPAQGALTSPTEACHDAAGDELSPRDADAVCVAATPDTAGCVATALAHGLDGASVVATCHQATPDAAGCVEDRWLDGLRGPALAVACYDHATRAAQAPTGEVYLAQHAGARASTLPGCGGRVALTTDVAGRLAAVLEDADDCATVELRDVTGERLLTGRVPLGAGPFDRTAAVKLPSRLLNAAGSGLRLVLRDGDGQIRQVVFVRPTDRWTAVNVATAGDHAARTADRLGAR